MAYCAYQTPGIPSGTVVSEVTRLKEKIRVLEVNIIIMYCVINIHFPLNCRGHILV